MKVAILPGALRRDSLNRKLAVLAARELAALGVEVDALDLRDFPMPLYDGDLEAEQGLPETTQRLRARIAAADALFVASPEYNSGVPGTLKNAIDWASRPPRPQPFAGMVVALASASPGPYGGARGLAALRPVFRILDAHVISPELSVAAANKAFDDAGAFVDERHDKQLRALCSELVRVARALRRD
jgi:NAD(P)H-dependent FMN reductase